MKNYIQLQLTPRIISWSVRWRRLRIYRVLAETAAVIFPFILLGSIIQAINTSMFMPQGFFSQVYHLSTVIPFYTQIRDLLILLEAVTINMMGPVTAFLAAKFMAHTYQKDETLAGVTSTLSFFAFNLNFGTGPRDTFLMQNFGYRGIFLAFLLGITIGYAFRLVKRTEMPTFKNSDLADRMTASLHHVLLINAILVISLLISYGVSYFNSAGLIGLFYSFLRIPLASVSSHISVRLALVTLINAILWWAGIEGPLNVNTAFQQGESPTITQNLNYALEHNDLFNVPNPVTMNTTYYPFANFGGVGMMLALIIATLIVAKRPSTRNIAKLSLLPSLVNVPGPMLVGLPVILNPLLLIPFILTPLVNQSIAWATIRLHIMPPVVYSVPSSTPGPLMAFLGTNGNWVALIVSLICLAVSTLIYIPFVKLSTRVTAEVLEEEEKA